MASLKKCKCFVNTRQIFFVKIHPFLIQSRLKTDLAEVKEELRHREDDIEAQTRSIAMLESEKFDLMEALASRDDMLTSR